MKNITLVYLAGKKKKISSRNGSHMVNQTIRSTWEVTAEKVGMAVQKIVEVSHPIEEHQF